MLKEQSDELAVINHFIFAEKKGEEPEGWKFSGHFVFRKTGGDKRWCWKGLSEVCVFPADGAALVAMSEGCA